RPCMTCVDLGYAGMRVRRAQHITARFIRLPDVVDIPAFAPEEAQILFSAHRLPDRLHAHDLAPSLLAPSAPSRAGAGNAEAWAKTAGETVGKAARKAIMEVMEPLHDDDRRREAKVPRRARPIRKELWVGVVDRVRVVVGVRRGRGGRHLINLRRQARRILRARPAPVGLRADLDEGLPRLAANRERSRITGARRLIGSGPARQWRG